MSTPALDPANTRRARGSVWRAVALALTNRPVDYTAGSLKRAILLLAVPMILEMLMESLFALADIFWVSRLGRDAVAAVGLTEAVMTLIYAVAGGIAFGVSAIVARRVGEKNMQAAAHTAGQAMLIGVAISAMLGTLLAFFAAEVLTALGASRDTVAVGAGYARILLGGNVTVFMIFLINAIFRGAGDAALAMRALWLANLLNIVLGPCLIFGWGPLPDLGVSGAAVATNAGRGAGVLYQLWHLTRAGGRLQVRLRHLRPAPATLIAIARTASSGVAQLLITMFSWVALFKLVAVFGSAALAGYVIAIRIINFAMLPALGLANAGATLVGQSLGARKPERAAAAVRIATRFNGTLFTLVGVTLIIFAHPLVRMFTADEEVVAHGARALWIVSLGFPLYAVGLCLAAAFNGAGDTWTPTRLNFFCFWLGQLPLAWLLSTLLGLGPLGVFIAVVLSFSMLSIWSGILFKRGRWKLQRV